MYYSFYFPYIYKNIFKQEPWYSQKRNIGIIEFEKNLSMKFDDRIYDENWYVLFSVFFIWNNQSEKCNKSVCSYQFRAANQDLFFNIAYYSSLWYQKFTL